MISPFLPGALPCRAVLLPHREDVKLEHVEVSQEYLASFERRQGLQQAVIYKCAVAQGSWGVWSEGGEKQRRTWDPALAARACRMHLIARPCSA